MSSKPTGRARRALKQQIDAVKAHTDALVRHRQIVSVLPREQTGSEVALDDLTRAAFPEPPPDPVPFPLPLKPPLSAPLPPTPRPESHPRRPELDAWASPTAPAPAPSLPLPPAPDPAHPAHHLRPEQRVLLELITTGMNAAVDAQDAYDSACHNSSRMEALARQILDFRLETDDA